MRRIGFALSSLLLATSCTSQTPTSPSGLHGAPTAGVLASSHSSGATKEREPFESLVAIPVPSSCLGGTFLVTGVITGWFQVVVTPNGHVQVNEYVDFSQLTASFGDDVWTAAPGSHEIWSRSLPPLGDAARVVVHEGRSRFLSSTGAPNVRFVHRIHQLRLPGGEVLHNEVTFEAECYGPDR